MTGKYSITSLSEGPFVNVKNKLIVRSHQEGGSHRLLGGMSPSLVKVRIWERCKDG